jgi:hypothetical protein
MVMHIEEKLQLRSIIDDISVEDRRSVAGLSKEGSFESHFDLGSAIQKSVSIQN